MWTTLLLLALCSISGSYAKWCVSGTCQGNHESCLATVNTTCSLAVNGSCWTSIANGTVTASCSDSVCPTTTTTTAAPEATTAAGAETTSAPITNAPTTEAPTESPTEAPTSTGPLAQRKRRADASPTLCCTTHMCNAYKSSAVRINVSLAMIAGVILLVGNF